MTRIRNRRKIKALVGLPAGLAGVLAIALVASTGVSTTAAARPSPDRTVAKVQEALAKGKTAKAIELAEEVVAASPREPAYRALLGTAYLKGGRFESAAQALNDAMKLGDNSARTALALALAEIGAGAPRDAVAILDDWRDAIPPADRGLALALAGETGRGVAILADALRGGENTPKVRQNLAYAYALDGRWREARLMAAQDVPANQISDRIGEWASRSRPEDHRQRVAALLSVPVRADQGQPTALALVDSPANEQVAAESGALASLQPVAARPAPMAGELPAVTPAQSEPAVDLAQYRPVVAPMPAPVATPVPFAAVAPVPAPEPVAVAPVPVRTVHAAHAMAPAPRRVANARPAVRGAVAAKGTHLVQLGAFSSQQGARRAWGIYAARSPQLKKYRMTISGVTVRGKRYWRVAAAGFDAGGASGLCSSLKARGGTCFAYAVRPAAAPMRGAKPAPMLAKVQPARSPAGPANARRH